jgi:2-polyprenyl-3-methyl-5-hydroxy-6-metoxy-1,4-benzoquinol methylase
MSRNYNAEIVDNKRKYAYNFDYIMHGYMIKSFSEQFKTGAALELGCFQGAFTQRLAEIFNDLTCIEASSEALSIAKQNKKLAKVKFIESMFEDAMLNRKYENVILTHVLEHIDDRIALLKKIRQEWLADEGVFFVACPNAYAPSRQIAVEMGLIEHPESVTPAEKEHGHRVTYSMQTLKEDLLSCGFKIMVSSGIFFKALANFQWDKLIQTDIISKDYLDGCYELGKKYPELCSSIYFVCRN